MTTPEHAADRTRLMARASDMQVLLDRFEVIALHQCWRGAAAIIVSLLGWFRAECEMSAVRPAMGTEPVAAAVAVATQA